MALTRLNTCGIGGSRAVPGAGPTTVSSSTFVISSNRPEWGMFALNPQAFSADAPAGVAERQQERGWRRAGCVAAGAML